MEKLLRIVPSLVGKDQRLTYWLTHNKPGVITVYRQLCADALELHTVSESRLSFLVVNLIGTRCVYATFADARAAGATEEDLSNFDRQVDTDMLMLVLDWSPGR